MRSAADVVDPGDPLRIGADGDDRVGPGVEVLQELVQVVTERLQNRPFQLTLHEQVDGGSLVLGYTYVKKHRRGTNP